MNKKILATTITLISMSTIGAEYIYSQKVSDIVFEKECLNSYNGLPDGIVKICDLYGTSEYNNGSHVSVNGTVYKLEAVKPANAFNCPGNSNIYPANGAISYANHADAIKLASIANVNVFTPKGSYKVELQARYCDWAKGRFTYVNPQGLEGFQVAWNDCNQDGSTWSDKYWAVQLGTENGLVKSVYSNYNPQYLRWFTSNENTIANTYRACKVE